MKRKTQIITFIAVLVITLLSASTSTNQTGLDSENNFPYRSDNITISDPSLQESLKIDQEVPIIVIFKEGRRKYIQDFNMKYTYHLINGVSGSANTSTIKRLLKDDSIAEIYFDGTVSASQLINVTPNNKTVCAAESVNANELWDKGIGGRGVLVAVLDSGIDKNHPDLAGKVIGEKNFVDSERTTEDLLGHGTAVAGIIAGSGTASGGVYKGVAPGASLLNVRVINSNGGGQISNIIAGIEWALENDADVLSMSLGGLNLGENNPPLSIAADNAMESGTVVCVAAGNLDERLLLLMAVASSVCLGCVESPGDGVKVITAGSTDCENHVAMFSGSGPLRDGRFKPTLVAPGVNVISTVPPDVELENKINPYYASSSGTSLSTPVAAGIAALLLQANPDLTPAGVKAAMINGAIKLNNTLEEEYETYYQGAGLLNAERSLSAIENEHLCGVLPDHWSAGRWAYGDFQIVGDKAIYGSLDTGADRTQKKIYALAPGDVDWNAKFLFITNEELVSVTTATSGPASEFAYIQPLPRQIPANGQRIFGASISVPEDAKPGIYKGSIDISEDGDLIYSMPLTVEVANPIEIEKGRGLISGELSENEWHYYYVDVPPSTEELKSILIWEGNSDLDIFLLDPTSEHYISDQKYSPKSVIVTRPPSGRWMLAIHPRNVSQEESYVLEVERLLVDNSPRRWSLGPLEPGEIRSAQFNLTNGGADLYNISYGGMVEGIKSDLWNETVEEKGIWILPLDVTSNVTRIGATLKWDNSDSDLALLLFNVNDKPVDISYGNDISEEVGFSRPTPGLWQVWVYGFKVDDTPQPFDLEATLYTQENWPWISASGPSELKGEEKGIINATLAIPYDAPGESIEGYVQINSQNESFSIPVSLVVAGASLTGNVETDLLDEDGDGLFERLCVDLEVDVIVPGDYRLEGSLTDGNHTSIAWLSNIEQLYEERTAIKLCVDGEEIWDKGTCAPLRLENLFLFNEQGDVIDRLDEDIVIFQCPTDFKPGLS